ncbi:MAG TPA: hypothetical protein VFL57_13310, partial [Bryobacteraceae bacterium]|nr:hypothetical protein [Bryobacteraceae bacterium]
MTRRTFLSSASAAAAAQTLATDTPWYRRTYRWGQTNITEADPERYDIAWWRAYWKRTRVQGVIINAGGIVAYYPSSFPLHKRAEFLGGRDLYGELARAAHDDGLVVLARMDSNRAAEDFYRAHPDWFTVNSSGQPYRAADKYITCVNSPYYHDYIPGILREIIERSRCEGLTDNSWSGLGRESICYCANCTRKFRDRTGKALPARHDWDDPVYREWILWNYARRLEIWDLNNKTAQAAGGPDCVWLGMNSGSIGGQSRSFRDYKEICRRAPILMLDHQARSDASGFQHNSDAGKLIHNLLGWDKLIPESMPMYQAGGARQSFRVSAKPVAEARMWMIAGFAGGIQPWWHHVGAYHEDRRAYRTVEPVVKWHEANQQYLVHREPYVTVGVVWSQRNTDFYGREAAEPLVDMPWRGMTNALIRAHIPYMPLHADYIERDAGPLFTLILPNLAAMSDEQCAAVRRFAERGGSVIATGMTSLLTEMGDTRPDFALADVFGVHAAGLEPANHRSWATQSFHTYLRLSPELRARVDGPKSGSEPIPAGERHEILRGFEETDILPFGGKLHRLKVERDAVVPLTFVPEFPVYPPETAWMREPKTDIPAAVLRAGRNGGRVAFLAADIDRRYARENLPDHANLIANIVRWAANGRLPLAVEGRGVVDCNLYRQRGRVVLHLVNLTNPGAWRAPLDDLYPIGPLQVRIRLPNDVRGVSVKLLVSGETANANVRDGWA